MSRKPVPQRMQHGFVLLRAVMGWIFLHSGLDKLESGIHFTYASVYLEEAAPLTTPELSFTLSHLVELPILAAVKAGAVVVEPLFHVFAATPAIGTLVILSELFIGIALILGGFTRLGAYLGAFLMTLFYYGNASWEHGLLNADLVYLILFLIIGYIGAGRFHGLDARIAEHEIVERHPWLLHLLSGKPT